MMRVLRKFVLGGSVVLATTILGAHALGFLRDRTFAHTFGATAGLDSYNAAFLVPDFAFNFLVASGIAAAAVLWWVARRPSNQRRWAQDQVILPEPVIEADKVHIKNIRNFTYRSEGDYTPGYYDKTFDVCQLQRVYFVFTPFTRSRRAAHAFLSFEFAQGNHVAISIEIRKKHQEKYSAIKGLLKQYELMYVIADEADVIKLRTNYRHNDVFMYPLRLDRARSQALFLAMITRARQLTKKPEFYNTIRNACVTNLADHFNEIVPGSVPFDLRLILSGYADRYWHALGLFDTPLPYDQARAAFYISDRARQGKVGDNFSQTIRTRQSPTDTLVYASEPSLSR